MRLWGMAREIRDPRARRPSGSGRITGDAMTETNEKGATDFSALLDEQKAVITAMNDKLKALESRNADLEAKVTALSGAAAKAAAAPAAPAAAAAEKSEQEKAYEKVLADLGLKKAGDL